MYQKYPKEMSYLIWNHPLMLFDTKHFVFKAKLMDAVIITNEKWLTFENMFEYKEQATSIWYTLMIRIAWID